MFRLKFSNGYWIIPLWRLFIARYRKEFRVGYKPHVIYFGYYKED